MTPRDRVEAALLAAGDTPAARVSGARPIAIGWATVDLDRAAAELAASFDLDVKGFRRAPRSVALGGACLVAVDVLPGGGSLALLEPDTEGRLAASLARLGEGPTVTWLAATDPAASVERLLTAGLPVSAERPGPFGPERLVVDGPAHGPHRLLVGPSPGTIAA